jgi:hypothetical protein
LDKHMHNSDQQPKMPTASIVSITTNTP